MGRRAARHDRRLRRVAGAVGALVDRARPLVGHVRQGRRPRRVPRARAARRPRPARVQAGGAAAGRPARRCARVGAPRQGDSRPLPGRRARGPAAKPGRLLERARAARRPVAATRPLARHAPPRGDGRGRGAARLCRDGDDPARGLPDRCWPRSSRSRSGSFSPIGASRPRCSGSRARCPARRWRAGRSRGLRSSTTARRTPTASATGRSSPCSRSSGRLSSPRRSAGRRGASYGAAIRSGGRSRSPRPRVPRPDSWRWSSPSATRSRGAGTASRARRRPAPSRVG